MYKVILPEYVLFCVIIQLQIKASASLKILVCISNANSIPTNNIYRGRIVKPIQNFEFNKCFETNTKK